MHSFEYRRPGWRFAILLGCGCLAAALCLGEEKTPRRESAAGSAAKSGPQFSAERLTRSLRAGREDIRFRALADAERLHFTHSGLPDALWQAIQYDLNGKRIGESTFAAIRLHGRLDGPHVFEQQKSLLSAADARIVVLAMQALATRRAEGALPLIVELAERPTYRANYGFRQALVCSVGRFADRACVDFLVSTLAKSDGQLKYEASRQLAKSTGRDFGGNAAAWRSWWTENREGFPFPEPSAIADVQSKGIPGVSIAAAPRDLDWGYDVPTFYGTPVYAKRVVFVIDRSLSMLSTVDEVTRLREAQREFEAALEKLPSDAAFNVLAYETLVTPWQPRLVQATPAQKESALRFANGLEAHNKTACYEALVDALAHDANIEAVLFLSDGEPSAGRIVDRLRIVQEITRLNAFSRTSINTIGIDAQGESAVFLRQLAEMNFGTYRAIR